MRSRVEIQPGFCILWAFLILTLPMKFLMSAMLAALFHEACHALAVRCLGGRIMNMTIAAGGMIMEVSELDPKGETVVAFSEMVANVGAGQGMGEAVTAFCRSVVNSAQPG